MCDRPIQGRRNGRALTCAGECARKRAVLKTAAWAKGERLAGRDPRDNFDRSLVDRKSKLRGHGLPEDIVGLFGEEAVGTCNACGREAVLTVDHDHACCSGKKGCSLCVRGFLCHPCNLTLGNAQDDVERLLSLAAYLIQTESTRVEP